MPSRRKFACGAIVATRLGVRAGRVDSRRDRATAIDRRCDAAADGSKTRIKNTDQKHGSKTRIKNTDRIDRATTRRRDDATTRRRDDATRERANARTREREPLRARPFGLFVARARRSRAEALETRAKTSLRAARFTV
jgi:hypothetical protein